MTAAHNLPGGFSQRLTEAERELAHLPRTTRRVVCLALRALEKLERHPPERIADIFKARKRAADAIGGLADMGALVRLRWRTRILAGESPRTLIYLVRDLWPVAQCRGCRAQWNAAQWERRAMGTPGAALHSANEAGRDDHEGVLVRAGVEYPVSGGAGVKLSVWTRLWILARVAGLDLDTVLAMTARDFAAARNRRMS